MIATTAITDITATTFPMMVSTVRILLARRARMAMRRFSPSESQKSRRGGRSGVISGAGRPGTAGGSRPAGSRPCRAVALDLAVPEPDHAVRPRRHVLLVG